MLCFGVRTLWYLGFVLAVTRFGIFTGFRRKEPRITSSSPKASLHWLVYLLRTLHQAALHYLCSKIGRLSEARRRLPTPNAVIPIRLIFSSALHGRTSGHIPIFSALHGRTHKRTYSHLQRLITLHASTAPERRLTLLI